MSKVKLLGVTFWGSGKFTVCFTVPAVSGTSKKSGDYEGYGFVSPFSGYFGVTTPDLKEKIIHAVKSGTPVSLIYDSRGMIADISA